MCQVGSLYSRRSGPESPESRAGASPFTPCSCHWEFCALGPVWGLAPGGPFHTHCFGVSRGSAVLPCPQEALVEVPWLRSVGRGTAFFRYYKYLHSSPSFKQARVGRTLSTGGCSVAFVIWEESVPRPKHSLYPFCAPGTPRLRRGEETSEQQHAGAQRAPPPPPTPPAAHRC